MSPYMGQGHKDRAWHILVAQCGAVAVNKQKLKQERLTVWLRGNIFTSKKLQILEHVFQSRLSTSCSWGFWSRIEWTHEACPVSSKILDLRSPLTWITLWFYVMIILLEERLWQVRELDNHQLYEVQQGKVPDSAPGVRKPWLYKLRNEML